MTQEFFFHGAKWIGAANRTPETFSVIRGHFHADAGSTVTLHALGLGFFKCYINGKCINPDTFLPLSSDYEGTCDPVDEVLSGHRIYVPEFDISSFVTPGDNVIALHFGGGWYTHAARIYGLPKAIYSITVETGDSLCRFGSDEHCRVNEGFCETYRLKFEKQRLTMWNDCFSPDFDDSRWDFATLTEALETEYCTSNCPADALIEELPVKRLRVGGEGYIYDCGQNTTGYPVIRLQAKKGELVRVILSEELLPDGNINRNYGHSQEFQVVSDGEERIVQPEFSWFGFRCFEIAGAAEPVCVKVIHADVPVTSAFDCDNETLNWLYRTFIHTMLCNMHTGHPSDCPHIERLGYTGDGQLTCHAALTALDAEAFYKKWLQDIADGQDTLTGHIQYTAPYFCAGGGPGGWGSAIVEVPWQLYRHFGDKTVLETYYGNMRRYIEYLEAHSEFGLVTSDKQGQWCLGDWCGPNILYPDKDVTFWDQQVMLPAPMVNTYFMVKSLNTMCRIARILGKEEDIPAYEEKAALRSRAIKAAYFNSFDGNFIMNVQGANAFAVDIGLGSDDTYQNLREYYRKVGCFDTGIFATDILMRVLFERGDGDLAVDLLSNDGPQGFAHWQNSGATTFHEYWDSNRSRSHNHPMFGAPAAYLFEYLLGIRQNGDSAGYRALTIAPQAVSRFGRMSGSMKTPRGTVSVSYVNETERTVFHVAVPGDTEAVFRWNGRDIPLCEGDNELVFPR